MCSQLLFGETYSVTVNDGEWLKVRLDLDGYEGWINGKGHQPISEEESARFREEGIRCSTDLVQLMTNKSKEVSFPVLLGSSLPGLEEDRMDIAGQTFIYHGAVSLAADFAGEEGPEDMMELKHDLVQDALQYKEAPYLWGGRSLFGIDCSGLVQMAYKLKGISLNRDAWQQAEMGEPVESLDMAEPGDLAFFANDMGKITHVGLLIDRQKILHCSGKVRVDLIDATGIYHNDDHEYTHKLKSIRRIL
jgi:hypothetical protein